MAKSERDPEFRLKKVRLLLFDCDGVLTDGRIVLGGGNDEFKFFSTKDGMGIALWRLAGFMCGCLTGRTSESLTRRAGELSFDELHQGVTDKRKVISEILARRGLTAAETAYIGDDLNDLPARDRVGFFFAPADAHPAVRKRADLVLSAKGGRGAVREAIDRILEIREILEQVIERYCDAPSSSHQTL